MPRKRFDEKNMRIGVSGFLFPPNIGRGEYLARNLGLTLIAIVPLALMDSISAQLDNAIISLINLVLIIVIALFGIWFAVIPRINDLGWNKKLAWLMFIPFAGQLFGFVLLITPKK